MVFKLTRKLDSNAEHVFFQKLRSKKILIHWEPEKTDIKDNFLLFLVALPIGLFPLTSKRLQFQMALFPIWLWGLNQICVFWLLILLMTFTGMSASTLIFQSLWQRCTTWWSPASRQAVPVDLKEPRLGHSFRKTWGAVGSGGGEQWLQGLQGDMPSLRRVRSRMWWRSSYKRRSVLMEKGRCRRGWSLVSRTNSWEEQLVRKQTVLIKGTFLSWTWLVGEGVPSNKCLAGFQDSYSSVAAVCFSFFT